MIFHWLKLYGKPGRGATAVVDRVFARAGQENPDVFSADSFVDDARKAKFEHACPWLALELAQADAATARGVMEAMVDRIEVGLREASVGDMKVGREVRAYAAALNGRLQRYVPLIRSGNWVELAVAMAEHGVDARLAAKLEAQATRTAA